jgi:hypothetical protein
MERKIPKASLHIELRPHLGSVLHNKGKLAATSFSSLSRERKTPRDPVPK